MQNLGIVGNFVLLYVLNNMPPIITSKANPGGQTHMKVIQASKVATRGVGGGATPNGD